LRAAPRFSNVFHSNMVLQRGKPIDVWGFDADSGTNLMVALGVPDAVPLLTSSTGALMLIAGQTSRSPLAYLMRCLSSQAAQQGAPTARGE